MPDQWDVNYQRTEMHIQTRALREFIYTFEKGDPPTPRLPPPPLSLSLPLPLSVLSSSSK